MVNSNRPFLAALLVLAELLPFAGCTSATGHTESIRRVLRQDKQLSDSIATEIGLVDKLWSPSGSVAKYVKGLRQIDLSGCPPDFELAFIQHIQAWEAMRREIDSNTGLSGFVKSFFSCGSSVPGSIEATEGAEKRVQETWFEVERVALKYGVRLADAGL